MSSYCTCGGTTPSFFFLLYGRRMSPPAFCPRCLQPPRPPPVYIHFNFEGPYEKSMDPNETLFQIRELVKRIQEREDKPANTPKEVTGHLFAQADDALNLSMFVEALDEWMTKGGFPPQAWKKK